MHINNLQTVAKTLILLLSATTIPDRVLAQPSPLIEGLHGTWMGGGTLAGRPMQTAVSFAPTAGGRQLLMIVGLSASGVAKPVFEGMLTLPSAGGIGRWHDSQGAEYEVTQTAEGDSIVTRWGPSGRQGKSVYRLRGRDSLEVRDYQPTETTGVFRLFGQYSLRRVGGSGAR